MNRSAASQRSTKVVEAIGLTRTYVRGKQPIHALRDVSIVVTEGEFLAVTGPSGSGKSTLLHLLGGIDSPDSGEVWLEGQLLSALPDNERTLHRRRRMGFVFQFFHLLPTLPAIENVALPLMLDGATDAFERAQQALAVVGLEDRADHRPREMSGGEQQRVAIARAIVTEPAVVLADEPIGNLDTLAGEEILKLLRRMADAGQTIIVATHDPRWAAYADRDIHLVDGRVAESKETHRSGPANMGGTQTDRRRAEV